MKKTLLLLFMCCGILMSAKSIKINYKTEIKPYYIKIEKIDNNNNYTYIYCQIKQFERFSYSISFEDCEILSTDGNVEQKGKLILWNDNPKINSNIKTISDQHDEKFVLAFPLGSIPEPGSFNLRIGTILDKNKTPLIIKDITTKKKK